MKILDSNQCKITVVIKKIKKYHVMYIFNTTIWELQFVYCSLHTSIVITFKQISLTFEWKTSLHSINSLINNLLLTHKMYKVFELRSLLGIFSKDSLPILALKYMNIQEDKSPLSFHGHFIKHSHPSKYWKLLKFHTQF